MSAWSSVERYIRTYARIRVRSVYMLLYVPIYVRTYVHVENFVGSIFGSVHSPASSCHCYHQLKTPTERRAWCGTRKPPNLIETCQMHFMASRTNFMPTNVSSIQYGKNRTSCIASDEVFHLSFLCCQIVRFMQYNWKTCHVCPFPCDCSLLSVVKGFQALMVFIGAWRSRTSASNRFKASIYYHLDHQNKQDGPGKLHT